jgi:uncharacterized membrane protein YgcG
MRFFPLKAGAHVVYSTSLHATHARTHVIASARMATHERTNACMCNAVLVSFISYHIKSATDSLTLKPSPVMHKSGIYIASIASVDRRRRWGGVFYFNFFEVISLLRAVTYFTHARTVEYLPPHRPYDSPQCGDETGRDKGAEWQCRGGTTKTFKSGRGSVGGGGGRIGNPRTTPQSSFCRANFFTAIKQWYE